MEDALQSMHLVKVSAPVSWPIHHLPMDDCNHKVIRISSKGWKMNTLRISHRHALQGYEFTGHKISICLLS